MKKTVLITGASRGIGKACAILFSMQGYNVAVNYNKSHDAAMKLTADINNNTSLAKAYKADVSDYDALCNMIASIHNDFGSIDVLINNAGISLYSMFTDVSREQWKHLCAVNLDSAIYCSQLVLPEMVKRHSGKIINISSIWGKQGGSCEAHYSVSKAGLIGLTKALAKEYASSGITVNCITPGVIETDMISCFGEDAKTQLIQRTPLNRLGSVTDVANTALFLASGKADFITGQIIGVDGGFC